MSMCITNIFLIILIKLIWINLINSVFHNTNYHNLHYLLISIIVISCVYDIKEELRVKDKFANFEELENLENKNPYNTKRGLDDYNAA